MNLLGVPVLFGLLGSTLPVPAAQPSSTHMNELASDKGCYLCHRAEPAKQGESLPLAPSWREIARKYAGQKNAEDRLTEIVVSGSGRGGKEHHWKGKVHDGAMLPNIKELDEDQARQLVYWILSYAP
jgi:cytochrome c